MLKNLLQDISDEIIEEVGTLTETQIVTTETTETGSSKSTKLTIPVQCWSSYNLSVVGRN